MPITACILCGSQELAEVIDFGMHPLADSFLKKNDLSEKEERYPLKLNRCLACGHVQSAFTVPPQKRYQEKEYSYDSGNSPVSRKHFEEMAGDCVRRLKLGKDDLAVDIGSSVGTLLQAVREQSGARVLGIEPAPNIAMLAGENGIPTVQDFFGERAVREILKHEKAKLITITNAFNHIDDPDAFMRHIMQVLADDGLFVIEVPYLLTLVERTAFDTAYLEHVSYFAVKPLKQFFQRHGLAIRDVSTEEYMGGSIRLYVGKGEESPRVAEYVNKEIEVGLYDQACYDDFSRKTEALKARVLSDVRKARAGGGRIVGVGAATKGNTLLNYCGIDASMLEFITDSSPLKIGKYTPGSRIPIVSDDAITDEITHALILPWNISDFLREKLSAKFPKLSYIIPHVA